MFFVSLESDQFGLIADGIEMVRDKRETCFAARFWTEFAMCYCALTPASCCFYKFWSKLEKKTKAI